MKLLTIQSLACYGKCSSTIALPVLSAMGIETTLLPTSLLSTHTGFPDFTFQDLTEQMKAAARHWQGLSLRFDAIYVGYLGSQAQLDFVLSFLAQQPQARLIVDPVMGDNGTLYSRITPAFIEAYQALCRRADLILPNLTEACCLLGYAYDPSLCPERLLTELRAQGAKNVVITGLSGEKDTLGAMCLCEDDGFHSAFTPRVSGHYHGTGDLFASVCCGALLRGSALSHALTLAADFTALCIQNTQPFFSEDGHSHWDGLHFETALPWLMERM